MAKHKSTTRTVSQILRDNVFTFFNLMNAVLGVLVFWVGSYKNMLFLMVVFFNAVIGIVQELRAKATLDKLSLIARAKVMILRKGQAAEVEVEELVPGDVMILSAGRQIAADGAVSEGAMEVDESLLTGESDAVLKKPGDQLFSGSFVVSGAGKAAVTRVGEESYANRIAAEARVYKRHPSQLRAVMNTILKTVGGVILPLGAGLFLRQHFSLGLPLNEAVVKTVAAVLGMIPEGLILLTSIALAAGVVKLGSKQALVRELYCIETLARVDVMCLDKTGTLTTGRMEVEAVHPVGAGDVSEIMGNLVHVLPDENETFLALKRHFPPRENLVAKHTWPFSSARKMSGAYFEGRGAYLLGAYEFLVPEDAREDSVLSEIRRYAGQGMRVLTVGSAPGAGDMPPTAHEIIALIVLRDGVRPEAEETLQYFREQDVRLMILSGDHPGTVSAVAKAAGMAGAERYVDASGLREEDAAAAISEYSIFGRVTPEGKKHIIRALKASGRTVAMVGDGVNDVPALKAADCSIAMAQGSDAAKQCANLVLMDSNFATMPNILREGRRVINNIQSAAALFLVKTLFSVILTVIMLIFGGEYPFMPIHLTLIGACGVGIPTFIFSMEPNNKRVGDFFGPVLKAALSGGITVVMWVLLSTFVCVRWNLLGAQSTMCLITTGVVSLTMIPMVFPLKTLLRKSVFAAMIVLFFGAMLIFHELLALSPLSPVCAALTAGMAGLTPFVVFGIGRVVGEIDKSS